MLWCVLVRTARARYFSTMRLCLNTRGLGTVRDTNSSASGLFGASVVTATFLLGTVRDTNSSMLGILCAPLVAAAHFAHGCQLICGVDDAALLPGSQPMMSKERRRWTPSLLHGNNRCLMIENDSTPKKNLMNRTSQLLHSNLLLPHVLLLYGVSCLGPRAGKLV